MVITDHLIIFLIQQLTVRVCACIRIQTARAHTVRLWYVLRTVTTRAFLSCSSSNSSTNSTTSTSTSTSSCSPGPRATRPAGGGGKLGGEGGGGEGGGGDDRQGIDLTISMAYPLGIWRAAAAAPILCRNASAGLRRPSPVDC